MLGTITVDPERFITDIVLPGCDARVYGELVNVGSAENDIVVKVLASTNLDKVELGEAADMMTLKVGHAVRYTCCVHAYDGANLHLKWDTPGREMRRRLDARYPTHLDATFSPFGKDAWTSCTVDDISAGGLRLTLPPNTYCEGLIDVKVNLTSGSLGVDKNIGASTFEVRCRVMRNWQTPAGTSCVGVSFASLDKRAASTLERLLDRLTTSI